MSHAWAADSSSRICAVALKVLLQAFAVLLRRVKTYGQELDRKHSEVSRCDCADSDQAADLWWIFSGSGAAQPRNQSLGQQLQPRCGLGVDAAGRFIFEAELAWRGERCPSGIVAEAAFCAQEAERGQAGTALAMSLTFLNLALAHSAAAGISCFDHSRWGTGLGISVEWLLSRHARTLQEATGSSSLERSTLQCPTDFITPASATHQPSPLQVPILVSCLVPLVWPAQRPFMEAIRRTYGPDCDELRFFVSLDDSPVAGELLSEDPGLINLRAFFPAVPADQDHFHRVSSAFALHEFANTIKKLLHMLLWAARDYVARARAPRWFCRLERDTFFIPENFRLLVRSMELNASDPHYLGAREFLDVVQSGLVFNDGGPGVCLSSAALLRLHDVLAEAPMLEELLDFEKCAFAPGWREDLMLAACLRDAGIFASTATTDMQGREWFSIRPLRAIPDHMPPQRFHAAQDAEKHAWNFWTGRAHLYLPCLHQNDFWVVDTPCSFNSFKNVSMFDDAQFLLDLPAAERQEQLGGYALRRSGLTRY